MLIIKLLILQKKRGNNKFYSRTFCKINSRILKERIYATVITQARLHLPRK